MSYCNLGQCSYSRLYVPSTLVPNSKLLLIGENPSWKELQAMAPFQGPAGAVLNRVLTKAGIDRSEISLTNLCMCCDTTREKKNPTAEEIDHCLPRLLEEIALVDVPVLVLLGALPMAQFYTGLSAISKVRGKPRIWNGRIAVATFHPARAIATRNPEVEQIIYEDILLARSLT